MDIWQKIIFNRSLSAPPEPPENEMLPVENQKTAAPKLMFWDPT